MHTMTDLETAAAKAAGNWKRFTAFVWWEGPPHADQCTLVYTHNRDSDVLELSNAGVIAKHMAPYVRRGWVREEDHSHWAVGWVKGYSIRVYRPDGKVSRAYRVWWNLQEQLKDYPILDEDDLGTREHEEVMDTWEGMGLRDRIELCAERHVSIMAARRDTPPESVYDLLRDRL
jgi:hypothetical protein